MESYIVFDLEWNQGIVKKDDQKEHHMFEIIEIGAVKLNDRMEIIDRFHRLIRPQLYQTMHPIIADVTHMSMEKLRAQGEAFPDAMRDFLLFCGDSYHFCTWGSMDLTELQRNMTYYGMDIPFERPFLFYDVQKLYSIQYQDGKNRDALDVAVHDLALQSGAPFHRALDDAEYTAKILKKIDMKTTGKYISVDYYRPPEAESEEFTLRFPEYSKFVSCTFHDKDEAMQDKHVTDMVCCECSRMLRKKIRWFSYGQKYYLGLAVCPVHGYMKGKIRFKKTDDGDVFAVKTIRRSGEEGAEFVTKKKEEAKKRRSERQKARADARRDK